MNNNTNEQGMKFISKSSTTKGKMKRAALLLTLLSLVLFVGTSGLYSELCVSSSVYDDLSWTWSEAGPCSSTYNCLSYALGITNSWTWPWGSSNPTSSQVNSYLATKGYYTYGYNPQIISYGPSTSSIAHFSKVTGSSTCRAKCGSLNLLDHGSWDPYYPGSVYGSKRAVYYGARYMQVSISGPTNAPGEAFYKWCVSVSYGTPPYSFKWYYFCDSPSILVGTAPCYSYYGEYEEDFRLDVEVTDAAGYKAYDSIYVTVGSSSGGTDPIMYAMESDYVKKQIDANMSALLDEAAAKNIFSGNPYDYIDSPYFREIVQMGPAAIMNIRKMILTSPQNGLKEYILAIASEKIAGVDLKGKSAAWANAKEFCVKWDNHISSLPAAAANILASDQSVANKNKALVKLGIPAVPYIVDEIERGKNELNGALKMLTKASLSLLEKKDTESLENWKKKNNETLKTLRNLNAFYKR